MNPMDKFPFQQNHQTQNVVPQSNIFDIANRAKQNPREFEEYVRMNNPQAYQMACQIRNSVMNPQEVVLQMAQRQGINPNIIKMFNL